MIVKVGRPRLMQPPNQKQFVFLLFSQHHVASLFLLFLPVLLVCVLKRERDLLRVSGKEGRQLVTLLGDRASTTCRAEVCVVGGRMGSTWRLQLQNVRAVGDDFFLFFLSPPLTSTAVAVVVLGGVLLFLRSHHSSVKNWHGKKRRTRVFIAAVKVFYCRTVRSLLIPRSFPSLHWTQKEKIIYHDSTKFLHARCLANGRLL